MSKWPPALAVRSFIKETVLAHVVRSPRTLGRQCFILIACSVVKCFSLLVHIFDPGNTYLVVIVAFGSLLLAYAAVSTSYLDNFIS